MNQKQYEPIVINVVCFREMIKTDIIATSRWDVGAPDVDWNEE